MTQVCIKCNVAYPPTEFYAKNKTGKSKYCELCRKKRQQKVLKQRQRKLHQNKNRAEAVITSINEKRISDQIKQLRKDCIRFTMHNRNRLQVLLKKCENREELMDRTVSAIARRTQNQQRAEEILEYQITLLTAGIRPQHIIHLWRDKYGTNTGIESQAGDQENT